jgi:hypothetical protein
MCDGNNKKESDDGDVDDGDVGCADVSSDKNHMGDNDSGGDKNNLNR